MNDTHREQGSQDDWSSRNGNGTATAEPVDRRWFEEALRAQGFLVEAPLVDEDEAISQPQPSEPVAAPTEAPAAASQGRPSQAVPESDRQPAPAWGALGAAEPVQADVSVEPTSDAPTAPASAEVEPWAVDSSAGDETEPWAIDTAAEAAVTPVAPPSPPASETAPPRPIASTPSAWSPAGQTWEQLPVAPVTAATGAAVVGVAARQPIAPTTLPEGRPPVPTGALAVRLSRRTVTPAEPAAAVTPAEPAAAVTPAEPAAAVTPAEPAAAVTPAEPAAAVTPAEPDDESSFVAAALSAPVSSSDAPQGDPWTLPALQADLAAEHAGEAAHGEDAAVPLVTDATAPEVPWVAAPPAADDPGVPTAEAIARQEADLQAQATTVTSTDTPTESQTGPGSEYAVDAAADSPQAAQATAADAPPVDGSATSTVMAGLASPLAGSPELGGSADGLAAVSLATDGIQTADVTRTPGASAGIAALAPRPPAPVVGTSVDDGESDLWGLVGDKGKAAGATDATTGRSPKSQVTNIILTVFVALVVVVLVLGFVYLFTNLL